MCSQPENNHCAIEVKSYLLILVMIHIVFPKLYGIPLRNKNMRDVPPRAKALLLQAKNDGLNIHTVETDGGGECWKV